MTNLEQLTARVDRLETVLGLRGKDPRQMDAILAAVAGVFETEPRVITGPRRTNAAYRPRMIFCWLARLAGYTTSQIGQHIGRDHTTVTHACQSMEDQLDVDPDIRAGIRALATTLNLPLPERYRDPCPSVSIRG